jgi:hypothetical protein
VDRSLHITLGGALLGACIGFPAGMLYMWMRLGWRGVAGAKALTAATRKSARTRSWQTIVLMFGLAVAAAYMLGRK